ncbi:MAG: amidohydrolase family protein [Candidatus Aenigmarchaeota archaeon]|nr:amidohydrolase family protein [Candidatus Aenigmarchaeota archaeon]
MQNAIVLLIVVVAVAAFLLLAAGVDQGRLGDLPPEGGWDQIIDSSFEPVACPIADRSLDDTHYTGPLIDTHIHIAAIPDDLSAPDLGHDGRPVMGVNIRMTDYVCMMDTEQTSKVFAFFPVWEPIVPELLEVVNRTMAAYPDRFVPFLMPPENDNSPGGYPTVNAETLQTMLNAYPGLFKGYGEIGLYARTGGAAALPPDAERLLEIYPVVRERGLLVYVHLGEGQKESFERALEDNQDISFIWHGDQLIPYVNGEQDLSNVEDILSNHPNAYYGVDELYGDVWLLRPEVSKEEFLAHFADPEPLLEKDLATWKGFIERHPDQVLWGTDRGWSAPWSVDPDVALTLNTYSRAFIGRLDPAVQEKFAYQNAENLISTLSGTSILGN